MLITGAWIAVKGMISNSMQEVFSGLFMLLIQSALILIVLTSWKPIAVDITLALTDDIAVALSGDGNASAGLIKQINKGIGNTVVMVLAGPKEGLTDRAEENMGWWAETLQKLEQTAEAVWFLIKSVPSLILMSAVGIAYMLVGGLLIAVLVGVQLLAEVSLIIAAILGPILLAWSILPLTSFLRDSLFRFTFNAIILKAVAIVMALLFSGASEVLLAGIDAGDTFGFTSIIVMCGLLVAMIFVAIQATSISSALTGGSGPGAPGDFVKRAINMSLSGKK